MAPTTDPWTAASASKSPSDQRSTCDTLLGSWERCAPLGRNLLRLAGFDSIREGLQAVNIAGGVAGNVVPDECVITVNYRFAPDRDADAATAHVRDVFAGFDVEVVDIAAGATPGLQASAVAEFVSFVGAQPAPKLGWTDVARFTALGVPAVNFGPGDPSLAHAPDEHVPLAQLHQCESTLVRWLSSDC